MFASTTSRVGTVRSTGSRTPKLRYRWITSVVPDLCRAVVHTLSVGFRSLETRRIQSPCVPERKQ